MNDKAILELYKPTRSKVRCAFCNSRACYKRVFTHNGAFDEVACNRHWQQLHRLSDIMQPKAAKVFSTSTGKQRRGGAQREFEACKREIDSLKKLPPVMVASEA